MSVFDAPPALSPGRPPDGPDPADDRADPVASEPPFEDLQTVSFHRSNEPQDTAWIEVLEQTSGPGAPRKFPLAPGSGAGPWLVGRSPDAAVHVRSTRVTRSHFVIERVGPQVRVRNLSEPHGTHLNGVRIHSADLRDQDQLCAGDAVFLFRRTGT